MLFFNDSALVEYTTLEMAVVGMNIAKVKLQALKAAFLRVAGMRLHVYLVRA